MSKKKTNSSKPLPLNIPLLSFFVLLILLPVIVILLQLRTTDNRSRAATGTPQFLQAQGKNLVFSGSNVVLRGANFDNIGALGADIGTNNVNDISINESDYQQIKALGGNHARLGLSYTWWKDNPNQFFNKLDEQVNWAHKHNIFLLLLNFVNPDGGNGCYEGYGNHCSMWGNSGQQQELLNFWKAVATRYKDEPAVIGYDLVNEPTPPGPNWCTTWYNLAQNWIIQLTPVAPNQLLFIEACSDPVFDRVFKNASGTKATNVVYETHDYVPMNISHPGYNPSANRIATYPGNGTAWIDGVEKTLYFDKSTWEGTRDPSFSLYKATGKEWADKNDVPIYVGEWGVQSFTNGYTQYIRDRAEVYTSLGMNHAYYTWKHDINGGWRWGMINSSGGVDQAKIDAVKVSLVNSYQPNFDSSGPVPTYPVATTVPTSVVPTTRPNTPVPGTPVPTVRPTIRPTIVPTGIINSPTVRPTTKLTPTSIPGPGSTLQTNNPKIQVKEVKPLQGSTSYLQAIIDPSITVRQVDWYINGRWAALDKTAPYLLGSEQSGYVLPSQTNTVRVVVYYNSSQQYVEGSLSYPTVSGTKPTLTPQPTVPTQSGLKSTIEITEEWPEGYCAKIVVTNNTANEIKNWRVYFTLNNATLTNKSNGSFVNLLGNIIVTPNASIKWLPANGVNDAVDYCANKTGTNWRPSNVIPISF